MARTAKSASAPKAAVAKKEIKEEPQVGVEQPVEVEAAEARPAKTTAKAKPSIKVRELKPTDYVAVRNGFAGKLIYISKHTGEHFVWSAFGDEQDMELQELKHAKNSSKGFFEKNWFLFDDPAVITYLGLDRMYENTLSAAEFEGLFSKTPEAIEEVLKVMPDGQKMSLAYFARQKIADHEIDSLRVIDLLEKYLNVPLIER